jgi:uncharacterized protein (DUF2225 family)
MSKAKTSSAEAKLSFQSKEEYTCPVCGTVFRREELLSGGGRLNAGALTDELHRLYIPSARFGDVYPQIYLATVCPACWFAAMDKDFEALPRMNMEKVKMDRVKRVADINSIFSKVDFYKPRNLVSGTASQYLLVRCYEFFPKEFSPTSKQGIASLRAGWLFEEMDKKNPGQHYDWLAELFKKKAMFFYNEAIFREQSGKETLSGLKIFGPDTDKNYGYDGFLYLTALLRYKYGFLDNLEVRAKVLDECKRTIAKIFGVGKSSKEKPGPLLESARKLYDDLTKELNEADA